MVVYYDNRALEVSLRASAILPIRHQMTAYVGDDVISASAGTFVVLPRGVPHRYEISEEFRALNLITPAGFEGFSVS